MKPHLRHIMETQAKKQAAQDAENIEPTYSKYKLLVQKAKMAGYSTVQIIEELRNEADIVRQAKHEGDDPIFKTGVENAKRSCLNAIELIISELAA